MPLPLLLLHFHLSLLVIFPFFFDSWEHYGAVSHHIRLMPRLLFTFGVILLSASPEPSARVCHYCPEIGFPFSSGSNLND